MLTKTPVAHLPAPVACRLAERVIVLAWHESATGGAGFRPHLDRAALGRPHAAVALDEGQGLRAALVRLPAHAPAEALIAVSGGDPRAPGLPVEAVAPDIAAMAALLPEAACARLLGFLLDVGGALFGLHGKPAFHEACARLAASLVGTARTAEAVAALPGGFVLLHLPEAAPDGALHLIGRAGTRRLPATLGNGPALALAELPCAGDLLVQGGPAPLLWRMPAPAAGLKPLLAYLEANPAARAGAARLMRAATAPVLAPLLREVTHLAPRAPQRHDGATLPVAAALELALPDGAGGLFLKGFLRDPLDLVASIALARPEGDLPIAHAEIFRHARPDLVKRFARAPHGGDAPEGFVLHLPGLGTAAVPQPELKLVLHSGTAVSLVPALRTQTPAAARDTVLGSVPPEAVSEAMLRGALAPAARALHKAAMAASRVTEIVRIGHQPAKPKVSVLIPLYRNLAFLRAQLAAFACDHGWDTVETIFVLDSPEQRAEVEHLLRGLHLMHRVPMTLVVMPRNLGYAAANNAGAALARGKYLLLLNSDVVPDRPGWLARLTAPLDADRKLAAVGPKLLFEDQSIQHAGLFFARGTEAEATWFNNHYFKGFPRHFAPACVARAVPGVTGAALLVRKALFTKLGGINEDYIIGDYEDSDFCLRLREAGHGIAYLPEVELWHFERRSIKLHSGYARTLASRYNRDLHHARWDDAITTLMARFAGGRP